MRLPCGPRRGRGGADSRTSSSALLHDRVTPELVAESGEHAEPEGVLLARREAREEAERDRGSADRVGDALVDRPAALARVVDVGLEVTELRVFVERAVREIEEPAADDRAVAPDLGDGAEVEPVRALLEELEALRVRLH